MSTKYIANNWRLPNEENSNKSDNYGLSFDGSNEFINFGSSDIFNYGDSVNDFAFSVSVWIYRPATGGFRILDKGSEWQITINGSNTLSFSLFDANGRYRGRSCSFTETGWNHIVCTYDGRGGVNANDGIKIYANNVQVDDTTVSNGGTYTAMHNLGNDANLGRLANGTGYTNGNFSEVAVFDYALSSTQISTLYGSSELGSTSPMALKPQPVGYWPLGDNSSGNPLTQPNEAVEDASVFEFVPNDYIIADVDGTGGSDSSFELGSDLEFTVSFWFNRSSSSSQIGLFQWANVITSGSPFLLIQQNSNNLRAFYDGGYRTNIVTSQNIWYHITITRTATDNTLRGYLNGSEWFSYDDGGTPALQNVATSIYFGNGYGNYFTGKLSNGQVWNTALSDSEIETLYNSGVPLLTGTQPQASSLRAWYKLDQSANWEADSSGAWQIPDAVSSYPQSFNFDGSDDFVSTNFNVDNYTNLTYSVWVNPTSLNQRGGLASLSSVNNFVAAFWDGSGGKFYVYIGNVLSQITGIWSGSKFGTLGQEKWLHIAVVYDGSGATDADRLKVYADGDYVAFNSLGSIPTSIPSGGGDLIIGKWTTAEYDGKMSNVMLFDSSLPATGTNSIETLYNNGTPLTTAIASDNLKLWAKLDNTATFSTNWSIPDASGNGNTGTSSGMTEQNLVNNNVSVLNGESSGMTSGNLVLSDLTRAVPYDSYSFNFDSASSDYIDLGTGTDFNFTGPFTLSVWAKKTGTGSGSLPTLFNSPKNSSNQGGYILCEVSNRWRFYVFDSGTSNWKVSQADNTIVNDSWYNITAIYDGSIIKLYVNGVLQADTETVTGVQYTGVNQNAFIGEYANSYFNGVISNVSLFNQGFTSTEVLKLYANGVPQNLANFNPQPQAWYPLGSNSFWNGSQWTVRDMIGSNDGTGQNIGVDGLVGDAPRSEANGTGTNMDLESNIVTNTKWSENNSISINMSSEARVQDTP